jgi:hypothetical protein
MKYRVLVDVHYRDLLVEADSEEDVRNKVFEWVRTNRPYKAGVSKIVTRIREPWKKQLENQ